MDERKPKPDDPEPPLEREVESQPAPQGRAKVEVAEPEPLSVVVVDTPAAEPAIAPDTQVEVPVRVPARTEVPVEEPLARPAVPTSYLLLIVLVIGVLFLSFKNIYQPLMVHVEDSVERRMFGEPSKIYQAPQSNPHTHQEKEKRWLKW